MSEQKHFLIVQLKLDKLFLFEVMFGIYLIDNL